MVYIPGDDVRVLECCLLERHLCRVRPALQLLQLIDKEDSLALRACSRFHNPSGITVLLKLLLENGIISRQQPSQRHNIHVDEHAVIVTVSDRIVFLLHFFAETLNIFDHEIFSCELISVRVVVDDPKNGGQQLLEIIRIYLLHVSQPCVRIGVEHSLHGPG